MTPDTRPVLQSGVEFAASAVTAENPHGFLDADGRAVWRRFDKPECVPIWVEQIIPKAKAHDFAGLLWWQPAGHVPDRPQYLVDSHLVPPDIDPQFQEINAAAHAAGLWVGSLLRPAELGYRDSWDVDGCYAVREFTADVKSLLSIRIAKQAAHGAGDAFYLDSFGLNICDQDAAIARWLRQRLGPDVPLFAEMGSDLLAHCGCGCYAEWSGTAWTWYGGQLETLQWLYPEMPVLALDRTWQPYAERLAWAKKYNVAPMFLSEEVLYLGAAMQSTPDLVALQRSLNEQAEERHAAYRRRFARRLEVTT